MGPGHPFPEEVNENSLDQPILIDYLNPEYRANNPNLPASVGKPGCETWAVAWSPDGRYFAWSCGNRIVKLVPWNRYKHRILDHHEKVDEDNLPCKEVEIDAGELVWSVAFGSSTAETKPHSTSLNWYRYKVAKDLVIATGLSNGRIRVWDVLTGSLFLELLDHREVIRDLKFAPDGSLRLVSASRDGTLKVWDLLDDGNMVKTLKANSKWLFGCAWSPDSKLLCSVGDSRSVILWDMCRYKEVHKLKNGHYHDVCSCDFSPDGALLATSSYDTRVIIWDPHSATKLKELCHMFPVPSPIFAGGANGSYVRSVSFSHDGMHISTVADDGYLRFWDMKSESAAPCQIAQVSVPLCCTYSPDGECTAVGTRNGSVTLWLAPMRVLSLQHCCRMSIRRLVPAAKIQNLCLPPKLKSFVQYKDLHTNSQ